MANVWTFGPPKDGTQTYGNGDQVPHRGWMVWLNGVAVGEVEVHMHKRYGPDGQLDVSFGITTIVYSEPAGGK